jgi:hypothetical protein
MRSALIGLLGDFREEPGELDLNEAPPLQSVDLDALQDKLPGDGREEVARLRALEMNELLATVVRWRRRNGRPRTPTPRPRGTASRRRMR